MLRYCHMQHSPLHTFCDSLFCRLLFMPLSYRMDQVGVRKMITSTSPFTRRPTKQIQLFLRRRKLCGVMGAGMLWIMLLKLFPRMIYSSDGNRQKPRNRKDDKSSYTQTLRSMIKSLINTLISRVRWLAILTDNLKKKGGDNNYAFELALTLGRTNEYFTISLKTFLLIKLTMLVKHFKWNYQRDFSQSFSCIYSV